MKLTKYYSPDNNGSGDPSGGQKANPIGNFGALNAEFMNENYPVKEEVKEPAKEEQKEEGAGTQEPFKDENKEENPPANGGTEKTPEQIAEEQKQAGQEKIEGFIDPEAAAEQKKAEEAKIDWIALSQQRGWELTENTKEAYLKAEEEYYNPKIEEQKKITYEKIKEGMTPDAQMTVDLLNAGKTLDEIMRPTKEVEAFKAMSDAELVRKDLELQGYDAEMVEKEMEKLVKDDLVEHEAKKLRLALDDHEKAIQEEYLKTVNDYREKQKQRVNDVLQQESKVIEGHLTTVKDFMETPLNDGNRNNLMKNYREGKYDKLMKDPEFIVKFMLFAEYGDQAIKSLRNKSFEAGRSEYGKKLHNVPPLENGNLAKRSTVYPKGNNGVGNFEALSDFTPAAK